MSQPLWEKPRQQLWIVFVVALLLRAGFILYYGPILTNDSDYYLTVARGILLGEGLGLPYRSPPVYPLFLAATTAFGLNYWPIVWMQAVVGASTCVFMAAVCQRLFQPRLALALGIAVALYIPTAAFCATVLRETLIGFGVALTTYCLVRSFQEQTHRWSWATGAACAFTLFNQATFLFFPFWLTLAWWVHSRNRKLTLSRVAPSVACMGAALCLWGTRNYIVTSHFIPLSADHIGYFFLEGIMDANAEAKALTPEQIRHLGIAPDDPYNTYAGMRDTYWGMGASASTNILERKLRDGPVLFSRAKRLVLHDPGKYLFFSLKRLHRLWFKDLWVERDSGGYLNLRPLDRVRREWGPGGKALAGLIYLFGYSSVIGMALFWRSGLGLLVPLVTMLSFHMWVHAETRYALAIHPHLLIFSLLTAVYAWERLVKKSSAEQTRARLLRSRQPVMSRTVPQTGRSSA